MMKRKIIKINEEKCNGCRLCIPNCPEGALQIIDNKARLVSDLFCDGLGACIGHCPEGAIEIEEREAQPYDEATVMRNIVPQGPNVIRAHLEHLLEHKETGLLNEAVATLKEDGVPVPEGFEDETPAPQTHRHTGGCPGAAMRDLRNVQTQAPETPAGPSVSRLQQWPVQLQLLNPMAPYFQNADLLVAADCVPFAYPNFHERFLKDKIMLTFCPKLDRTIDQYIEKLAAIFTSSNIQSVSVVRMEVPCCGGTLRIVEAAMEKAQKVIPIREYTITISGDIL